MTMRADETRALAALLWVAVPSLAWAGEPTETLGADVVEPAQTQGSVSTTDPSGEDSSADAGETDEAGEQEGGSGVVDLRARVADDLLHTNAVVWAPMVVAGGGINDSGGERVYYGGAYVHPLALLSPRAGQWVTGVNAIRAPAGVTHELQTEYRCPFGFGVGAGYLEPADGGLTRFGKVSFDHSFGPIRVLAAAQMQDVVGTLWPGAYGAVVWEHAMGSFGHDGEQWRATLGLVAPEWHRLFAPAVEGFFIDSTVGQLPGTRFLFVNFALASPHPFLSNGARLGRAMGPQGVQFSNPLGFLSAIWNRAPDTWELGRVITGRILWEQAPDESVTALYEGHIYPFHFDSTDNFGDALFAGGFYRERPVDPSAGFSVGLSGSFGELKLAGAVDLEVQTLAPGGTAIVQIPF